MDKDEKWIIEKMTKLLNYYKFGRIEYFGLFAPYYEPYYYFKIFFFKFSLLNKYKNLQYFCEKKNISMIQILYFVSFWDMIWQDKLLYLAFTSHINPWISVRVTNDYEIEYYEGETQ